MPAAAVCLTFAAVLFTLSAQPTKYHALGQVGGIILPRTSKPLHLNNRHY